MSRRAEEINTSLREGVKRLLARADDARALDVATLLPRVRQTIDKHLLRAHPDASPREIGEFIDALRADDLCLVVACEQGSEAAWRDLIEQYTTIVRQAARSATGSHDAAEELVQSVWAELHGLRVGSAGGGGKLAYYSGCGSFSGWLQAVVRQLAINSHRQSSRFVQVSEDLELDLLTHDERPNMKDKAATAAADNPEQMLSNKLTQHTLHTALARVIGELSVEDRLLIKLYYVDGLRLREAGLVLGVHEATASRRLAGLHREVRARVEAVLLKEHRWTKEEIKRSLAETAKHMDVDLDRLLAIQAASGESQNV